MGNLNKAVILQAKWLLALSFMIIMMACIVYNLYRGKKANYQKLYEKVSQIESRLRQLEIKMERGNK